MPRDGSGNWTRPAGASAVASATASSSAYNDVLTDLETAITNSINTSGTKPFGANQSVGGFKFTSMGAGAAIGDAVNLAQAQGRIFAWASAGGTADVITATLSPAITAYTEGMQLVVRGAGANTVASPTVNFNAVGAKKIYKGAGAVLVAGDIAGAGHDLYLTYNTLLDGGAGGFTLANPQSAITLDIVGMTALTAPAVGDLLPIYDLSTTSNKQINLQDMLEVLNVLTEDLTPDAAADFMLTFDTSASTVKRALMRNLRVPEAMWIAVGDETTVITTGTNKLEFRMPYAMTLTSIPRASLKTAPTGTILTVDINEAGVSILGTKLTIDIGEKTSVTAASAATLTDTSLADDAIMTIDVDGAGTLNAGLKIILYGHRT